MLRHVVSQGECLSSIARRYGLPDWRTIYDHPANVDFRKTRPNPNVIQPGDELLVPEREPRREQRPVDHRHPFVVQLPTTHMRIVVADRRRHPVKGSAWRLEIGTLLWEGTTGPDGLIEVEIPADAQTGRLEAEICTTTGERMIWPLALGALDPWDTDAGVQARLNNLGFPCGRVDGVIGRRTRTATRRFQELQGLKVDGIPGPVTRRKLREVHGC